MRLRSFLLGFVAGAFLIVALRAAGVHVMIGNKAAVEKHQRQKIDTLRTRPEQSNTRRAA